MEGVNDNFIDPQPHDYENVNPSEDKERSTGHQSWGPVNKGNEGGQEEEEEGDGDGDGYEDMDGFIPVNRRDKKPKKDRKDKKKKPRLPPKGPVEEGYRDPHRSRTTTHGDSSTTLNPLLFTPPANAIYDEFGVREAEYIHNYKPVRHPKGKQHERRKKKGKHRDDRLVGKVGQQRSGDQDT